MQIQAGAVPGGVGSGRGESRPLLLDELTQYISLSLSFSVFLSQNVLVCVHTHHVQRDTNTGGCKLGLSITADRLFCSRASSPFLTSAAKIRLVCVLWTKEPRTPFLYPSLQLGSLR